MESSRQATIASHTARREGYLRSREEAKRRRKREALHRVAPGFEPEKGVLKPTSLRSNVPKLEPPTFTPQSVQEENLEAKYLDQLAEQLSKIAP